MSECHRVWVPAENSSCNLFITRAAVKFSVLITNESGRALTLAGLAIDKMLRQEYYLPKNAQYEIREGNVREITVYDVPSTGDNNGYYTFKRTYGNGVTLMAGEEKIWTRSTCWKANIQIIRPVPARTAFRSTIR